MDLFSGGARIAKRRVMPGTQFGIMDALGFVIVATVLFLPVVWLVGYFIWEVIRSGERDSYRIILEDPANEQVDTHSQKKKRIQKAA